MSDFLNLVQTEKPIEVFDYKKHIVNPDKINNDVKDFFDGKMPTGYKIGIDCFDEHFVCKEKAIYPLTGKKGKGKTTINKIIQLMQSIVNGLVWVVAFKENTDWGSKIEYLQYLLGDYAKDVERSNPQLYKKASDWIDKHFIFLDVKDIKTAIEVTESLIKDGVKVYALLLDPVNSFRFGYKDTGNIFSDGVYSSQIVQDWVMKNVSIFISQHPNIRAQREKESVTPFDAEYGFWNNKGDFTWVINRHNNTNLNEIGVWNVREKLTGGSPTSTEDPLIIEWFPTSINITKGHERHNNVIQTLLRKHNPLKLEEGFYKEEKPIPTLNLDEAFGDDNPF